MDTDKIEMLVDKIDQAIRIIENLKEENNLFAEKAADAEKRSEALQNENKKLKEVNEKQKIEIDRNEKLHKRLEEKIQLILKYLPEENPVKKVKKEIKKDENIFSEKEEEVEAASSDSFAQPVQKIHKKEKKELFNGDAEPEIKKETISPIREEFNRGIAKKFESEKAPFQAEQDAEDGSVDIKYGESLKAHEDEDEVNFYLDEEDSGKNELPKGVL